MSEVQGLEVLILGILMMIEVFFRTMFEIITTFPMACIFLLIVGFGIAGSIGNAVDMRRIRMKQASMKEMDNEW